MGWILALLAGGLVTFNAVVTPDKAADAAADALKKKFPGAQVSIKIEGKRGKDVLNGRFKRIDVALADLTLDELPVSAKAPTPAPAIAAPTAPVSAPSTALAVPAAPTTQSRSQPVKTAKAPKAKLGRAGELNLEVRRFRWNRLDVERADFHFENVEYDFGALKERSEFVLVRAENAKMHLELAPAALTPFVATRAQNITEPRVSIADDQLSVAGQREFYGLSAPFTVQGAPGFSGSQVILQKPTLLVSGVTVPAIVATPLLKSVNPLYSFSDLKDLPFDVKLTNVYAREGKLQIDADLTLRR